MIMTRMGGDFDEEKEETFYAEHPFLFFLIERKTSQILFMGRVSRF